MPVRAVFLAAIFVASSSMRAGADSATKWAAGLPVYDHIVVVLEENKDFDEVLGDTAPAPYIKGLARDGATLARMYGEEHNSEGNYFWLFSGSDQNVGFDDDVPDVKLAADNLGEELIAKDLPGNEPHFRGYSESLPAIGWDNAKCSPDSEHRLIEASDCYYARKHVPWISFANVPNTADAKTSSNLRWSDFPSDYAELPTVAIVVPNLISDMHNGKVSSSVPTGDDWLRANIDRYYQWAKSHNSLLIVTFDESDDQSRITGFTDPRSIPRTGDRRSLDMQNRIPTIFAGAHVKPGYQESKPATHVNILRTIEAMYGLLKAGAQQDNAVKAKIDDSAITGVFETTR
jgi:hypothetical protein